MPSLIPHWNSAHYHWSLHTTSMCIFVSATLSKVISWAFICATDWNWVTLMTLLIKIACAVDLSCLVTRLGVRTGSDIALDFKHIALQASLLVELKRPSATVPICDQRTDKRTYMTCAAPRDGTEPVNTLWDAVARELHACVVSVEAQLLKSMYLSQSTGQSPTRTGKW